MKLSTKVRYGVRALIELSKRPPEEAVPLGEIAEKQGISPKYLEQIAAALRIAGLIKSVRGAEGGYRLARPAGEITLWDIYTVLDDSSICPSECVNGTCSREALCPVRQVWINMSEAIADILRSYTLAALASQEIENTQDQLLVPKIA